MDFYLITGSSRGLGLALAKRAVESGSLVVGVARKRSDYKHKNFIQLEEDLSRLSTIPKIVKQAFERAPLDKIKNFHLINNAAAVGPIGLFPRDVSEIEKAINLNLTAPILLTGEVIEALKKLSGWLVITNISSGVAEKPKEGLSIYSSTKAGLKCYSHALAGEGKLVDLRLKSVSLSPGVVDTEMQRLLREEPKDRLPDVERFNRFKSDGKLLEPEEVATRILSLLSNPEKINKTDYDIQELK